MEALRRARLVWALLCIIVAGGLALLQSFAPQPNALFITVLLWSGVWLWLPLYMHWRAIGKLAAVWFLGCVPLALLSSDMPAARFVVLSGTGVVALIVFWIASGLRRAPNT